MQQQRLHRDVGGRRRPPDRVADAYDAVRGVSARERDLDLGPSMAPGDGSSGSQLRGLTTSRWPTVQRRKINSFLEREQTVGQDLTAQRDGLAALGVDAAGYSSTTA